MIKYPLPNYFIIDLGRAVKILLMNASTKNKPQTDVKNFEVGGVLRTYYQPIYGGKDFCIPNVISPMPLSDNIGCHQELLSTYFFVW